MQQTAPHQQKDPTMQLNEFCQRAGVTAGPLFQETQLTDGRFQYLLRAALLCTLLCLPASASASASVSVPLCNCLSLCLSVSLSLCVTHSLSHSVSLCLVPTRYSVSVGGGPALSGRSAPTKKAAKKDAAARWLAQSSAGGHSLGVHLAEPEPEASPAPHRDCAHTRTHHSAAYQDEVAAAKELEAASVGAAVAASPDAQGTVNGTATVRFLSLSPSPSLSL